MCPLIMKCKTSGATYLHHHVNVCGDIEYAQIWNETSAWVPCSKHRNRIRSSMHHCQRWQHPTISQSNDVAKPRRRLTKVVATNVEGVCGGVYGGIPSPTGGVYGGIPSPTGGVYGGIPSPTGGVYGGIPSPTGGVYGGIPSPTGGVYGGIPSPTGGVYGVSPLPLGEFLGVSRLPLGECMGVSPLPLWNRYSVMHHIRAI